MYPTNMYPGGTPDCTSLSARPPAPQQSPGLQGTLLAYMEPVSPPNPHQSQAR